MATRKRRVETKDDDLRPEYDFSLFKGAVRGKYYQRVMAGTNLVLIDPEIFKVFPSGEAVNAALREVLQKKTRARSTGNDTGRGRRKGIKPRR